MFEIKNDKDRTEMIMSAKAINDRADAEGRDITEAEKAEYKDKIDSIHSYDSRVATKNAKAVRADELAKLESSLKESRGRISQPEPIAPIHEDIQKYSLVRAIRRYCETNGHIDGLEREVSDELQKFSGKTPQGFLMPVGRAAQRYGQLDTTTGAGLINSVTDYSNFIEILRARTLVNQLGVRFINDLSGNVGFPKQTATAVGYWINANGTDSLTPSQAESDEQVVLSPSQLGADLSYSRQFFNQTGVDADSFLLDDAVKVLGIKLDATLFNGSGSGAEPEGLLQNSDVHTISLGTNGANPTFEDFVAMETYVAEQNADVGNLAYVMTPALRGYLKSTPVNSNVLGRMIWENNEVNGTKAFYSNNVPSNLTKGSIGSGGQTGLSACLYGNWNDVIIGSWNNAVDVIVDPYTDRKKGLVHITKMMDLDIAIRHPESFVKIIDAKTV